MNLVAITGNLGRAVELKYIGANQTPVVNGSIAVKSRKKDDNNQYITDWYDFVAFNQRAEVLAKYTNKGDKIGLTGSLQQRKYQHSAGHTVTVVEIMVNEVDLPPRSQEAPRNDEQQQYGQQQDYTRTDQDRYSTGSGPVEVSDDDLPF